MSSIIPQAGNTTVIISAELDWRDDERNLAAHIDLRERLARQLEIGELYSVQVCEGAYKGSPERSIAITGPVSRTLAIARGEADNFSQESVLIVNPDGSGELRFTTDQHYMSIGHYVKLDSTDGVEAWTRVLATGETFTFI